MRCLRGGRSCEYTNSAASTIEFVQYSNLENSIPSNSSSETWTSVIEQQLTDQSPQATSATQVSMDNRRSDTEKLSKKYVNSERSKSLRKLDPLKINF